MGIGWIIYEKWYIKAKNTFGKYAAHVLPFYPTKSNCDGYYCVAILPTVFPFDFFSDNYQLFREFLFSRLWCLFLENIIHRTISKLPIAALNWSFNLACRIPCDLRLAEYQSIYSMNFPNWNLMTT